MTAVIIIVSIAGCTTVTMTGPQGQPVTRTRDELRTYAEAVFRLQNSVLDALIGAVDIDPGRSAAEDNALFTAEERIVADCRDLNEAASLSAEGREPGLQLKLRVLESLASCEDAALAAKAVLATGGPVLVSASPAALEIQQ